jgi:hypothetical protein
LDISQLSEKKFTTRPVAHSASHLATHFLLISVISPVAALAAAYRSCSTRPIKQTPQTLCGSVPAILDIFNNNLSEVKDCLLKINIDLASQAGVGGFCLDKKIIGQNGVGSYSDSGLKGGLRL